MTLDSGTIVYYGKEAFKGSVGAMLIVLVAGLLIHKATDATWWEPLYSFLLFLCGLGIILSGLLLIVMFFVGGFKQLKG